MELATAEKTLFELPPMSRIVPTTMPRMTANMTAYSAMSWPFCSDQSLAENLIKLSSFPGLLQAYSRFCANCNIPRRRTMAPPRGLGLRS